MTKVSLIQQSKGTKTEAGSFFEISSNERLNISSYYGILLTFMVYPIPQTILFYCLNLRQFFAFSILSKNSGPFSLVKQTAMIVPV